MLKVALVTGGTRGIGLGIANELYKDGYKVIVVGRKEPDGFHKNFRSLDFISGDIGDNDSRLDIIENAYSLYGRIDVLVNNAGVAPKERKDLLEMSFESMTNVLNINLVGAFFLTQGIVNKMIRQDNTNSQMRIINISSISAYTSSVNRGEYCVSKSGVSMLTKLYADRLSEVGINVFEVRPGIIKTDMTKNVSRKYDSLIDNGLLPIKRWGYPKDIGGVVTLLCSEKMQYCTGDIINVDGGFHIRRL